MRYLIIILLLVASPVWAATYYVDYGSTSCSSPSDTDYDPATRTCGSGSSTVYDTVGGVDAVVGSGDTVWVRECDETFANDDAFSPNYAGGSSENDRITYECYTGETCIFRGDPSGDNFIYYPGSYYSFIDFEFRDITSGRAIGALFSYATFKEIVVDGVTSTTGSQIVLGNATHDPTDIVFDSCVFDDIFEGGEVEDGDLIEIDGARETLIINSTFGDVTHSNFITLYDEDNLNHKTYIFNCTFQNTWRYDIDFYTNSTDQRQGVFIDNCVFKDQGSVANPVTGSQGPGGIFNIGGFGWMTIIRSELYDSYAGLVISQPGTTPADTTKLYLAHNTFYNFTTTEPEDSEYYEGMFIWVDMWTADINLTNSRIINNIFSETDETTHMWEFLFDAASNNPSGNVFSHNLFYDSDGTNPQRIYDFHKGWGLQSVTYCQTNDSTQWTGSDVLNDNPDMTDPGSGDFTLTYPSPARDAGDFLATIKSKDGDTLELNAGEEYFFFAKESFGIEYSGVSSHTIYAQDGASSVLTAVNYGSATIEVSTGEGSLFEVGDTLTMVNFYGSAPDIGANEYEDTAVTGKGITIE